MIPDDESRAQAEAAWREYRRRERDRLRREHGLGGAVALFLGAWLGVILRSAIFTYPLYALACAFTDLTLLPDSPTELGVWGGMTALGVVGYVRG